MRKSAVWSLGVWLLMLALCLAAIWRMQLVSDLSAFLPRVPNARQQVLVEQLRDGAITRLILIGITGGDAAERARLSRELARRLRANAAFSHVENGAAEDRAHDAAYFFDNRYLLSPAVNAARFSPAGLHQAIADTLDALSGSAGLMLKSVLTRDPTGEIAHMLDQVGGENQPHQNHGVWASADGQRALLLTQTRAAGSDLDAQQQAVNAIRTAFAQIPARAADTQVMLGGAGVLSVLSRASIEQEIGRLALAGMAWVICLLLPLYRSVRLLLIGLLPVVSGALAGVAAVSLGFGLVHGLTLAFGTTLIGEAVDYSVYFFLQRAASDETGNKDGFWRTLQLGVLTSVAGFAVMLFSGFPGLAQLGLYSISGLAVAALVTRWVLPQLLPSNIVVRDVQAPAAKLDALLSRLTRWRKVLIALPLLALIVIAWHGGAIWNRQLSALNPTPLAAQRLDQQLREDLGAADMRYLAVFTAPNQEAALQQAEQAATILRKLVDDGRLGSFNTPASILPSIQQQRLRQAALPDTATLRRNLSSALVGLPLAANQLDGFVADVAAAKIHPLLSRADLSQTSAALLLDSLMIQRPQDVLVLMPLHPPSGSAQEQFNLNAIEAALIEQGMSGVTPIDLLAETAQLFDSYLAAALRLSALGGLAILLLLFLWLRSPQRVLRVVLPLAAAILCVIAALLAANVKLSLLHLIGLLLVAAIGSNYALFFDFSSAQQDETERHRAQLSLLVANLATVGSFGILALSQVPLLAAFGVTVAPGAFLAFLFSALLARWRQDAYAQ